MAKITISICLLIAFLWQPTTLTARSAFPLETIYAHIDKQTYFAGENIWFRVYLVCSQTHVQIISSRYIYAELINSNREIVERVMIRHENGVFAGHIFIDEELEAGVYNLRFFTRHLENFGEEYFFQRIIHIITPQSLEERRLSEQVREDYLPEERTPASIPAESFAVSFHPEGGDIPIGIETLIAFNAINSTGLGEHITGVIVNERGDIITHIESIHLGMGAFELLLKSDEQLFAVVQNAAGIEKRFELPRAKKDAISLQVIRHEGNIIVYLPASQTNNRILNLSVQRGGVGYSVIWDNESEILLISEEDLPTGVISIVLSDARGIPLSKRQIFNASRTQTVNTMFTTESETHEARERVSATVTVTDSEDFPLSANFSISVIDNDIVHYDASVNILTTMLLTSDLRGHIEDPVYYFISENKNAKEHLDLVMLTHGWTRFDVIRPEEETAGWQDFERSQTITGTLQGSLVRRRANQPVSLLAPVFGFFDVAYTDNEGRFRFDNFEFPEGTGFFLQSERGTVIQVDAVEFPDVNNFFMSDVLAFDAERVESLYRFIPQDDIWSVELDELVVTGRGRRGVGMRNIHNHAYSSIFNRIFDREELEQWRTMSLPTLLQMLAPEAFRVDDGREPLILVDNMRDMPIADISLNEVESIEIAGPLGIPPRYTRVIMITLGGGGRFQRAEQIRPLGYQVTMEFYSPAYTFQWQRESERPDLRTTIFWNPNVTTGENGKAEFHFYTSDNVGNYVVIIEGVTDEGKIVHSISRLR